MSEPRPRTLSSSQLALAVKRLCAENADASLAYSPPLAIVGIGCRFPGGVNSLGDYWRLLHDGVDAITPIPVNRWDAEAYYDPDPLAPGKMNLRSGGFIEGHDLFDPHFFGIAPREATSMDPQQRLLLEVAWESIWDSGRAPDSLAGSRTGVFVAAYNSDYHRMLMDQEQAIGPHTCSGGSHSITSGRISYLLDLRGPSVSFDTACSSSLVAIHAACQSLRTEECDAALAAGVTVHSSPGHYLELAKLMMFAPDARCKTFDRAANGFVPGEGCGVVLLKRLADALANRDRIHAVIRGSAVNQDGRTTVLTAPNGLAQQAVIRAALRNARIAPSDISYVETHGTGTALGDPIEVEALTEILGSVADAPPCALGAVKTNFGHLEAAAGVAGLIKAALALKQEEIPPNLHFESLNPQITLSGTRFFLPAAPTPWRRGETVRFAGVSSFGFGGTNAHVVLEEAPRVPAPPIAPSVGAHLLPISARTPEALREYARRYEAFLAAAEPEIPIYSICRSAALTRTHYEERLALTASTHEEFRTLLGDFANGNTRRGMVHCRASRERQGTVFVCSGQGSQWAGMGTALYAHEPAFRAALDDCDAAIRRPAGWSLLEELRAPAERSRLNHTEYAQPAIFAIEVALARLWQSWGIEPDAVVGHSAGEIGAAHLAGILSLDDAAQLIVSRGKLLERATGQGRMAAVRLPAGTVAREIAPFGNEISIAAINSPVSTVISGKTATVETLVSAWRARSVECQMMPVDYAFHSAQMQPHSEELVRTLTWLKPRDARIPILSTVTGRSEAGTKFNAAYWGRNISDPVRFAETMRAATEAGWNTFIEIGPHPVLLSSVSECLNSRETPPRIIPSMLRNQNDRAALIAGLGSLYAAGHPVSWEALYRAPATAVSLPYYPYQRQRFWVDRQPPPTGPAHALAGTLLRSPSIRDVVYQYEIGTGTLPYLKDHSIDGAVWFPGAAFVEMALQAAAEKCVADMVILAPLVVSDTPCTVQLIVDGDHFKIHSLSGETWTLHAEGRFAEPAVTADISSRAQRLMPREPSDHYPRMAAQGADFGPAFRTVRALQRTPGEAVAQVCLQESERGHAGSHHIHPALLDGCLQAAASIGCDRDGLFLPFGFGRVEIFHEPGSEVWASATLREAASPDLLAADIDIYDRAGVLVGRVAGLQLKRRAHAAVPAYQREWRRVQRGAPVEGPAGLWLVLSGEVESTQQLVRALQALGLEAMPAAAGAPLPLDSHIRGVVQWIDSPAACPALLETAQTLARFISAKPPQLWVLTRAAVAVTPQDECDGLRQAPAWGLTRTIALEHPELRPVLLDVDDAAPSLWASEIASWDGEEEIALRHGERYVRRLARYPLSVRPPERWTIPARGQIDNLALAQIERRAPAAGEVEVEIEAAALNFRDVLNVLGMYPGDPGPLGLEFSGRIARAGEGVRSFQPGDRVMGIGWGSMAAFVTTRAELLLRPPAGLDATAAAALPNAFLTAYHCLIHLGGLQRGERVLIHAAAGGVGLAAVQVAQWAGAEVIATAGSEEKRQYLRSLGVTHVFDSRSLDFARETRAATGGEGVHVVLNSLAGEFIEAGFHALADCGRFLEIGKKGIWSRERAVALGRNIRYTAIDLAPVIDQEPALIQQHLAAISRLFEEGAFRALPVRVFDFDDAPAAFRYMAQARHIGKVVLRRGASFAVNPGACYLITGGLGSVGLRTAAWLADEGARHLILIGRSGPSPQASTTLEALRMRGVRVDIHCADVSRREDLQGVFQSIRESGVPLAGVVHAAGVLDDGALLQQTWDRMERVMRPKVQGAWNLHEFTAGMPLDFFLLYSSVASVIGAPGQAGYAAGNAFLDVLAHYRRARGLAALTVNWGAWAAGGMATRTESGTGKRKLDFIRSAAPESYFATLKKVVSATPAELAILDAEWSHSPYPRLTEDLAPRTMDREVAAHTGILDRLASAPEHNRRKLLVDFLRERVRAVLDFGEKGLPIDERDPLLTLGMDSLMAVEFRNQLSSALGRPLSATLVFDHPTVGALADFLGGTVAREDAVGNDALLEELDSLSDEEAETLLRAELERSR